MSLKSKKSESVGRSLVKTITYRIIIIIATFIVSLWITGDTKVSLGITSVSAISNTILYYIHERVWNMIRLGK